jgi:hypothetical protein
MMKIQPCLIEWLDGMRRWNLRRWTGGKRTIYRSGSNISDVAWRSAGTLKSELLDARLEGGGLRKSFIV